MLNIPLRDFSLQPIIKIHKWGLNLPEYRKITPSLRFPCSPSFTELITMSISGSIWDLPYFLFDTSVGILWGFYRIMKPQRHLLPTLVLSVWSDMCMSLSVLNGETSFLRGFYCPLCFILIVPSCTTKLVQSVYLMLQWTFSPYLDAGVCFILA